MVIYCMNEGVVNMSKTLDEKVIDLIEQIEELKKMLKKKGWLIR